jgi:hypothetical protein
MQFADDDAPVPTTIESAAVALPESAKGMA